MARLPAVDAIEPLGHDAIQPGALEPIEPVGRNRSIEGRRRQVDRRRAAPKTPSRRPALAERGSEVVVAERQQVPGDERRGVARPASSP